MPLELNYDIYNKELLIIVIVLKEWRVFLQGIMEPFVVKIDYKNLTSFLTTKELNQRQVKQVEMLTEYYFKIKYIKGMDNAKVDIFSRKAELQGREKLLDIILRLDKDGKIRCNYLRLVGTYKVPESSWEE